MIRYEVRRGGEVYFRCEMFGPPPKTLLLEQLEAGYQPYVNGRKVTHANLQPRKRAGQQSLFEEEAL